VTDVNVLNSRSNNTNNTGMTCKRGKDTGRVLYHKDVLGGKNPGTNKLFSEE
jgi:hypothetical protein